MNPKQDVAELLSAGFDVNAQDHFGETPLHMVARSGCLDTAKLLLKLLGLHNGCYKGEVCPGYIFACAMSSLERGWQSERGHFHDSVEIGCSGCGACFCGRHCSLSYACLEMFFTLRFAKLGCAFTVELVLFQDMSDILQQVPSRYRLDPKYPKGPLTTG